MKLAPVLVITGCTSLFAARGPAPTGADDPTVRCSSILWPALDLAVAGVLATEVATCNNPMCGLGATVAIPIAVGAALSATYGVTRTVTCEQARGEQARNRREAAIADERAARHEQAWRLMQPAAIAARAGDCTSVPGIDAQIRALDADFHAAVFVRDAAIARCLAAAPVTSPAASSSPSP